MSFDVHAAVRAAMVAGYSADPNVVADKIAAEVPAKDLRQALAEVLPAFVSTRLGLYRQELLRNDPPAAGQPQASRKSAAARLLAPMRGIDGWVYLKDCTRDDVLQLVQERRNRADAMNAMADRYEHLASLMAKRGARVVADLSERDIEAVFG